MATQEALFIERPKEVTFCNPNGTGKIDHKPDVQQLIIDCMLIALASADATIDIIIEGIRVSVKF
jgi:hypothetical protein